MKKSALLQLLFYCLLLLVSCQPNNSKKDDNKSITPIEAYEEYTKADSLREAIISYAFECIKNELNFRNLTGFSVQTEPAKSIWVMNSDSICQSTDGSTYNYTWPNDAYTGFSLSYYETSSTKDAENFIRMNNEYDSSVSARYAAGFDTFEDGEDLPVKLSNEIGFCYDDKLYLFAFSQNIAHIAQKVSKQVTNHFDVPEQHCWRIIK